LGSDANGNALLYFAHMSNHYLCLVKTSSILLSVSQHEIKFSATADSGGNYHIFKEREFLETLYPTFCTVLLGDGKTTLKIKVVGTVKCKTGSNTVVLNNVYVLDLGESIYSLFLHIQSCRHGFESSFDNGLFISFPDFRRKAIIGSDNMHLNVIPFYSFFLLFCIYIAISHTTLPATDLFSLISSSFDLMNTMRHHICIIF
jgi:hypothetical protein